MGDSPPPPGTPLDTVLTYRDRPSVQGTVRTLMNDADLHARFTTGSVQQHVIVGVELDREESDLTRFANQLDEIPGTPFSTLIRMSPFPAVKRRSPRRPDTLTKNGQRSARGCSRFRPAMGSDRRGARRSVPRPVRCNRSPTNTTNTPTPIASPRASLVYKPVDIVSIYASYGTSYDPSAENLSLSAKTASLGPEKDKTFEFGVKSAALAGRLALQAGVFQTTMTNARVGDPANPTAPQILAGEERVRGFEADAIGYLTNELEITAGYTYLDSKTVKSTDLGSVGAPLQNTAPDQANLWLVYEFHNPWKVGVGFQLPEPPRRRHRQHRACSRLRHLRRHGELSHQLSRRRAGQTATISPTDITSPTPTSVHRWKITWCPAPGGPGC